MTRIMRWTAGRRALVAALVVTLTVLWQWASWSGDRGLSILYIVAALVYVAGAVVGSVLMSRWTWRHRAVAVVSGMVAIWCKIQALRMVPHPGSRPRRVALN